MQQQCPDFPFPLCNKLQSHHLMLVLVIPGPVKTASSHSFPTELLTGSASYSHSCWTNVDHAWAAGSISQRWKCPIHRFPRGEEAELSPCKHPIACPLLEQGLIIFDLTSTGSRFKQYWSSEEEVEDLAHTRKQTAWQGSWLHLQLVRNCWKQQSKVDHLVSLMRAASVFSFNSNWVWITQVHFPCLVNEESLTVLPQRPASTRLLLEIQEAYPGMGLHQADV